MPTSLLTPITRFVECARERHEQRGLLRTDRLIALAGPGGSGKTRLALPLASGRFAQMATAALGELDQAAAAHPSETHTRLEPLLRIFALGPTRVLVNNRALAAPDWTYHKAKELLFYFVANPPVTKTQIGLDVWPDASTDQLRNIFHRALHHLCKALGQSDWIVFADDAYSFNRSLNYWCDLHEFEALLSSVGSSAGLTPADRATAIPRLEAAALGANFQPPTSNQQVLADAPISANPPTVNNVHLVGALSPVVGTVTLAWNASDPDGDPLKFDIDDSHDGGVSFSPIIMHTPSLSLPINTAGLGGGTGVFRVIASDGANLGSADSAPFTMASKPPAPSIALPSSNIHTRYGQVVNLSGLAWDAQDGVIAGSNLVWSSVTGTLHIGPLFTESLLPPGTNVITLTATNSSAMSASTSVTINVDDNIDPDGPTMQVAPGAITWHINSGITAPQTQPLTVTNFGTGSLTWQASSDSAWLTLSATSGSQDDSLTATGDPTGMYDGETRSGNVIFTSTSNGYTQTLTVPVSLVKGNVFQSPYLGPMPPLKTVYLPLIRK